jgi:peptidoglycan-associated lipoprotein
MNISFKAALAVALVVGLGACSCRTRGVGNNVGNGAGGPLQDVNFAFDSAALTAGAKETIKSNVEWLKDNDDTKVQVEGHADSRGTNEYNLVLGEKRAKSAADYLRSLGVEKSRVSTVSYGEEMPLDPAQNEQAWAKNRRAHFTVQE